MNTTQPESEINFDFLQDEAGWAALLEICREHWTRIGNPLRTVEVGFTELQRQLMQEEQVAEGVWDRLIEDFNQSPARSSGLRSYVETPNIAAALFSSPAGSLGWRDAAAIRLDFDRCFSTLLEESINSTDLRDALMGVARRVASKPDFYQTTKVARDKQRSRLHMDARVPYYYAVTDASLGTEQPKGSEPLLMRKLRLLAEWHLRHDCNAWHILKERGRFWTDAESECGEFLRQLFKESVVAAPEPVPAPTTPFIEQAIRSRWARFKDWLFGVAMRLWNTLLRRHPISETVTPPTLPPAPLLQLKPIPQKVELSKVPASRELWPSLQDWYGECARDADGLDQAGGVQDERIRGLEDRLAGILAGKQQLEIGVDVSALRADSTSRDLKKKIEIFCAQIDGLAEFVPRES